MQSSFHLILNCLDSYEAEKLSSMLHPDKDRLMYVIGIVALIKNEVVLMLKDKSCHSVIMKDDRNASRLSQLVKGLIFGKYEISEITVNKNAVEILHKAHS